MKTLLLSEIFPPKVGGSGRWFFEIYLRLPNAEFSVLTSEDESGLEFDKAHKLNIERIPMTLNNWGISSRSALRSYWHLTKGVRGIVKRKRVNRIHAGRCLPEGFIAFLLKKMHRIGYYCYVHGEDVQMASTSRELTFLVRHVLNNADLLISNSGNTAQLLKQNWQQPEYRVRVLHPGVDTSLFVPAKRDFEVRRQLGWDKRTVVLTVGRLQKRKGQDMMIRSLPIIRKSVPDVLYAIVGHGDERESLQKIAETEGVIEYVKFQGEIDDATMIKCYQQCDLFALPNRQVAQDIEGFGMVLLEAQACGRPVLAGMSGGTAETMDIPQTGIVVPCEEPEPLADAVTQLLLTPAQLEEMGKAAREWVVERFDWASLSRDAALLFKSKSYE